MLRQKVVTFRVKKLLHFASKVVTFRVNVTFCGITLTITIGMKFC